ncbi:hypothetical protein KY289_035979 [Solanum tuberosum]|nr:hypothetical protein KY289_035979 [Solanum tuberosum]
MVTAMCKNSECHSWTQTRYFLWIPPSPSEDGAGDDTLPTWSQPPISGAQVEEGLAAVWRRLGRPFASTTPVPPSIAIEVEMLHRKLR